VQRVFFSLKVAPERRQELLDALLEHGLACVGREPGTLRFDVLEDETDPNVLYLYEAYPDDEAFQRHRNGQSHVAASAAVKALRDSGRVDTDILVRAHSLFAGPHAV
jgi:autoinducer 2-degrading protein